MRSKQVLQREAPTQQVVTAAQLHGEKLAGLLAVLFFELLAPGETMPDWRLVMTLIGRAMTKRLKDLTSADDANLNERNNSLRGQRKAIFKACYQKILRARGLIEDVFSHAAAAAVGFSKKTPHDPIALLGLGDIALANLAVLDSFSKQLTGVVAANDSIAAALSEPVETLRTTLRAEQQCDVKAGATLSEKHKAIKDLDEFQGAAVDVLRGLFRMTGEKELAKQLLPRQRKHSRAGKNGAETPSSATGTTVPAAPTGPTNPDAPAVPTVPPAPDATDKAA